jgi:hypothetical protein
MANLNDLINGLTEEKTVKTFNGVNVEVLPYIPPKNHSQIKARRMVADAHNRWLFHRTMEVSAFNEINNVEEIREQFNQKYSSNKQKEQDKPAELTQEYIASLYEVKPDLNELSDKIGMLIDEMRERATYCVDKKKEIESECALLLECLKDCNINDRRIIAERAMELKNTSLTPMTFRRVTINVSIDELKKTGFKGWLVRRKIDGIINTLVCVVNNDDLGEYVKERANHLFNNGIVSWNEAKTFLGETRFLISVDRI